MPATEVKRVLEYVHFNGQPTLCQRLSVSDWPWSICGGLPNCFDASLTQKRSSIWGGLFVARMSNPYTEKSLRRAVVTNTFCPPEDAYHSRLSVTLTLRCRAAGLDEMNTEDEPVNAGPVKCLQPIVEDRRACCRFNLPGHRRNILVGHVL